MRSTTALVLASLNASRRLLTILSALAASWSAMMPRTSTNAVWLSLREAVLSMLISGENRNRMPNR
ncbi:hypothetical protein D3C78_1960430 [compost metagenome]